jgi:membrane protease YdiL (CAAX protease family)
MPFDAQALRQEDVLDALPATGEATRAPSDDVIDALPAPRRAHPGFWMSLLWCIVFMGVTQTPGSIIAICEMMRGLGDFRRQEDAKEERLEQEDLARRQAQRADRPLPESGQMPGERKPPTFMLQPKEVITDWFQSEVVRNSLMHAFAVTEICVILFSWVVIRLIVGADWKRKLALRRPGLTHTTLAVLGLPALWIVGTGAYATATNVLGIPGMETILKHVPGLGEMDIPFLKTLMDGIKRWPPALAILIIGLGPGIGEELWCRGFLGRGLVGRYGVVVGIVLTSFFFGLIHLDPAQGTMAMLMGVCLHFIYQTTRSLWLPILLHFFNNSLSVIAVHFPALDALEEHPERFYALFAASGALAAAIGYALYQSRARLAPVRPGVGPHWQPDYPSVEHPPNGSGVIVVYPRLSRLALIGVAGGFAAFLIECVYAFLKLAPVTG